MKACPGGKLATHEMRVPHDAPLPTLATQRQKETNKETEIHKRAGRDRQRQPTRKTKKHQGNGFMGRSDKYGAQTVASHN